MKILFFAKGVGIGGAEKKLLLFAEYLKKMFDCKCTFMTWHSASKTRTAAIGADHYYYSSPDDVLRIVGQVKPDIIHTTRSGEYEDVFDKPLEKLKGKYPIIESNVFGRKGGVCDYRLPISSEVLKYLDNRKPYEPNKAEYLWNATDYPKDSIGDLREELKILPSATIFGRISRSDNGIFSSLETQAYSEFVRRVGRGNYYYVSLGAPPKFIAESKGLYNTIVLKPTADMDRVAKFYNTIDIMLHANNMGESLGTKIQEAMSYGIPIVTHLASGTFNAHVTDLLKRDYPHVANARRDVSGFCSHMQSLYGSKDKRREISQKFKARSKEWMPDAIIPKLMEVYKKHLKKT